MNKAACDWFSARDLSAPGMRLFCLPHAGSGAAGFYRWKRSLPGEIAVCPVLLPGREMRLGEPSLQSAAELVKQLTLASAGWLDAPYAIFGHSMGALLAYAWAARIAEAGMRGPEWLFVSGRNAPQAPLAPHLTCGQSALHLLPDEEFVAELGARYGGTPETLLEDAELREVFLPILRADLKLVESFAVEPQVALECGVVAMAGVEDRSVSDAGLAAWRELTGGEFAMERFAGDHFYSLDAGAGQAALLASMAGRLLKPDQGTRQVSTVIENGGST